ncbi:tRNA lysidine(34) synthetase TilS [Salinimonas sp. HHU 13199]|uniref:tRNA(Ile)-lysidine synthase n=1 Tax=Salinimonas profundi TaxID=2729140 RepID=A0ABR8LJW1_9ALTE|nr:tRNA lysidine(34) synthetase TilS [Salinimonas profundi]MBD3585381.1 tRNA lysidine(34) synthetase TilS [Salinimonas profundi]
MAGEHSGFQDIQWSLSRLLQNDNDPQPDISCLVVGFSGGVDSTVLLHALSNYSFGIPIHAVYVNHGLSAFASQWQAHCQRICESLNVLFAARTISVSAQARQSLEAAAREGRYDALLNYCKTHQGALVLGQHQDDQAETFLLQAKRGAGPRGLSGMPSSAYRDGILVLRPMLHIPQSQITQTAHQAGLSWIDDESNADNRFDRNFLRNAIMPSLRKRWPGIAKTLSRSAALCAQQQQLLEEVVDEKLTAVLAGDAIVISSLQQHSVQWQQQIIRAWFSASALPMPGASQLEQILCACSAREDAQPDVHVGDRHVRRFAGKLYLVQPRCAPAQDTLCAKPGEIIDYTWSASGRFRVNQAVQVRAGMPSVTCKMTESGVSKPLKKWMKEWQIPVWERQHLPVLFDAQRPIAVVTATQIFYFAEKPDDFSVTFVD